MVVEIESKDPRPTQANVVASTNRKNLLLLALFCIVVYFVGLGSFGLIDRSEGYYAEGAREMFESGKYLIPKLNYVTFYDKPILMYWFQILSYSVLGVSEFAARFSTAVFASALVFATYIFGRKTESETVGLRAALILGSSPMFIALGRQCLTDMTFSFFMVSALFCVQAKLCGAKRSIGAVGYLCLALAFLTKGPLAVVLFGAVLGINVLAVCRSFKSLVDYVVKLDVVVALAVLSVVAAPWYFVAANETQGFWTYVFFVKGNLNRVSGSVGHSHPQLWFYLPILVYGFFPWIIPFIDAIYSSFSRVRKEWNIKLPLPGRPFDIFLWSWFVGMLIVLSVPKAKLQTYILPMLPAMSLLVAGSMTNCMQQLKETSKVATHIKVMSVLLAVIGLTMILAGCGICALSVYPENSSLLPAGIAAKIMSASSDGNSMMFLMISGVIICGAGLLWQCERVFKRQLSFAFNVAIGAVVWLSLAVSQAGFQLAYEMVGSNLHQAIIPLKTCSDAEVAIFKEFKPSVMFYLRRPISTFDQPRQLLASDSTHKLYIVLKTEAYPSLEKRAGKNRIISQNGDWMVIEKNGVVLDKLATLDDVLTNGNPTLNVEMLTLPLTGGVKVDSEHQK